MTFRSLACLTALLALGCNGDKPLGLDTGADTGSDDGGGSDTDDGAEITWDDLSLQSSVTLSAGFASGAGFYAVGEDGEVYLRSQGEWAGLGVDSDEPLNGIWGVRTGETVLVVAVGDGGTVARLDELGWLVQQELNTANMEAIAGIDVANLISVGWGGAYRWVGGEWVFQQVEGSPQFNAVWTDGTTFAAVGQDGVSATSSGGDWTTETWTGRQALLDIDGSSSSDLWAVGEDGLVLHNTGGGWEQVDVGSGVTLWSVASIGTNTAVVVGNSGFAALIDDSGVTELPTGVDNNLYDVTASDDGVVWAVGNRGCTLRLK